MIFGHRKKLRLLPCHTTVQLRPFRAASPLLRPFRCRIETKNLAGTGQHAIAVPPHSYDRQCHTTMLLPQPAPHRLQATTAGDLGTHAGKNKNKKIK
jgi:hypothetical protein